RLRDKLEAVLAFAERVAAEPALEADARQAAGALYHATSAVLMTWEASRPDCDARRALLARLVLEPRLSAQDPLGPAGGEWKGEAADLILAERRISRAEVLGLLG